MSIPSSKDQAEPGGEKASRVRQRQRLIEACISALYAYGPSRTTVEKVVSIANLSPGIVNFYFDSKAAMMVAALEFLAGEFEREVLDPVIACRDNPVHALELLVDLYLDPEIASPRKVSVWFAFWGEANSRREYYDICGKRDDAFAALVRDLIERLIAVTDARHLDADGIALGLIGALDQLWQNFAFEIEANIDRVGAKRRCKAFLRSVFPRQFGGPPVAPEAVRSPVAAPPSVGNRYADPALFRREADALFLPEWQFVGHESELSRSGDFLTAELLGERALVLRDPNGRLRAFRNVCRHRPHALTLERAGRFVRYIHCRADDLGYAYDGTPRGRHDAGALVPLGVAAVGGLVFVRLAPGFDGEDGRLMPHLTLLSEIGLDGFGTAGAPKTVTVEADWKIVVEQWLDASLPTEEEGRMSGLTTIRGISLEDAPDWLLWRAALDGGTGGSWAAARYARLALLEYETRHAAPPDWTRLVAFPNHLIDIRPDGATILQAAPVAPGRSQIRRYDLIRRLRGEPARALHYLGRRLEDRWLSEDTAIAASTQAGFASPYYQPGESAERPALAAFRHWLEGRLPAHADD
jgi:TetR/AcrR family transcriptional repressor of bet genes